LSKKRGGKSHFGILLVLAVSGGFCIANRLLLPVSMEILGSLLC